MFCRPEIRNPKAKDRTALGLGFRSSDFGPRPSGFGLQSLRSSGLKRPGPTLEQPWRREGVISSPALSQAAFRFRGPSTSERAG